MKYAILIIIIILEIFFVFSGKISAQWILVHDIDSTGFIHEIHQYQNSIYAATSPKGMYRSDNNGINWTQINTGLSSNPFIQSITSKDDYIFIGGTAGVFRSSDQGNNWALSSSGISQLNITTMTSDQHRVYAGCIFAGIFSTTNQGVNWTRFGLGEGDLLNDIYDNGSSFFAGITGTIYRTTNAGVNWMLAQQGLTNNDVQSLTSIGEHTYCATYGGGVFRTANSSIVWSSFNTGINDTDINTLNTDGMNLFAGTMRKGIFFFDNPLNAWRNVSGSMTDTNIISILISNGFVFAGSNRGKIWRRPFNEIVTGIIKNSTETTHYKLLQNFPNPFNPSTKIIFEIPENNVSVRLTVTDILGKEIATPVNEQLERGSYETHFNGSTLSAGIYFSNLFINGLLFSNKKMLLVK